MKSKVKKLMGDQGMTIEDLHRLTGLAVSTILRIRSSKDIKHCSIPTLMRVARVLDVEVWALFEEDKDIPSSLLVQARPGVGGNRERKNDKAAGKTNTGSFSEQGE